MYIGKPEDGLRLETHLANIYVGWNFEDWSDIGVKVLQLHLHFFPDTLEVKEYIFKSLILFLRYRDRWISNFEKFIQEGYKMHKFNDNGCFLGTLDMDFKNPKVAKLLLDIEEDSDELRNRLRKFLEEIFKE